jgi:hypothetical protein
MYMYLNILAIYIHVGSFLYMLVNTQENLWILKSSINKYVIMYFLLASSTSAFWNPEPFMFIEKNSGKQALLADILVGFRCINMETNSDNFFDWNSFSNSQQMFISKYKSTCTKIIVKNPVDDFRSCWFSPDRHVKGLWTSTNQLVCLLVDCVEH